jgi:hypothetical protein
MDLSFSQKKREKKGRGRWKGATAVKKEKIRYRIDRFKLIS